jgi:Tetracyclin repressor-like, C-terminal domain
MKEFAMTDVIDQAETDVRERIPVTAERLFCEIGYRKTTLADIDLRMSSANVYRFFDSKKSINASRRRPTHAGSGTRVASYHHAPMGGHWAIARAARNRTSEDGYAADSKMHEMVAVAMQENWDVCKARIDCIIGIAAAVIVDGVASSEFDAPEVGNSPALTPARQRRAPWKKH